jgi:hypothetical protein
MHRLLVLYPSPTDPDHFRSSCEDTHLKLVAQIPGLLSYRYGFDFERDVAVSRTRRHG